MAALSQPDLIHPARLPLLGPGVSGATRGGGAARCAVFDRIGGLYGEGARIPGAECVTIAYHPASSWEAAAVVRELVRRAPALTLESDVRGFDNATALRERAAGQGPIGAPPISFALFFEDGCKDKTTGGCCVHADDGEKADPWADSYADDDTAGASTPTTTVSYSNTSNSGRNDDDGSDSSENGDSEHGCGVLSGWAGAGSLPVSLRYELWFNATSASGPWAATYGMDELQASADQPGAVLVLQAAVNEAVVAVRAGIAAARDEAAAAGAGPTAQAAAGAGGGAAARAARDNTASRAANLDLSVRTFPDVGRQLVDRRAMVISELGPMFFFIGAAAHFLVTVGLVAGEKEAGLLLALRTLAVADGAGHIGWFAPLALTGALAQALMVVLARYAFGIPLFVYCDARVLLMLFTLYSSAMIALALLIAAALPNARQAHALAFVLFVVGLMLQVLYTADDAADLSYALWDPAATSPALVPLALLFPPTAFAKVIHQSRMKQ